MGRNTIKDVEALENGTLKVIFETGNAITLDMTPRLDTSRFGILKNEHVWNTADTDGTFVHWYQDDMDVVELSYDELMQMTVGDAY